MEIERQMVNQLHADDPAIRESALDMLARLDLNALEEHVSPPAVLLDDSTASVREYNGF